MLTDLRLFFGLSGLETAPGRALSEFNQILYNLLFAQEVLIESGEQSDGTSL
jgi:hypothetical protein